MTSPTISYNDTEAAQALIKVIGSSRWEAVALAHGFLAKLTGKTDEEAARIIYNHGPQTLTKSKELIQRSKDEGIINLLTPRERIGSAQNPITKLFPATITEQRFIDALEEITLMRRGVDYRDDRKTGHKLTDFTLEEDSLRLPINIKNAGTRFENAMQLVGLEPDDCIPIPAYKAHAALEVVPSLLYVISVDYSLVSKINTLLPALLSRSELIVWDIISRYSGSQLRDAEDLFIFSTTTKYWDRIKAVVENTPFHVISARKSVRILQTKPQRTPGIGLKAWGTGASAEVNVHVSIKVDTTPWSEVRDRIVAKGLGDVLSAVNRKRLEEVYDPEI